MPRCRDLLHGFLGFFCLKFVFLTWIHRKACDSWLKIKHAVVRKANACCDQLLLFITPGPAPKPRMVELRCYFKFQLKSCLDKRRLLNEGMFKQSAYCIKTRVPKGQPPRGLRKHDSHTEAALDLSQTAPSLPRHVPDPYQTLTRPSGITLRTQMKNAMNFAMDF